MSAAGHRIDERSLLEGHTVADDDADVDRVEKLDNDQTEISEK